MKLVLASGSSSRAQILRDAGVTFAIHPADIDEDAVKHEMRNAGAQAIAEKLAELKSLQISTQFPQDLVLGADQVLALDNEIFSKAETLDAAAAQLRRMRGKCHQLVGALVLARDGKPVWRHTEISKLWVRAFSEEFLKDYLKTEGKALLGSVGCYRLEGMGAQLFERVEGDYFSILGLSLLPLVGALRDHGVLEP
ncbi:MAG TPA: nucleoside triphosphate pyrophosphatase [Rhizomicrobium sp.]|nr:nucleoside triphosphate pyrophosphatase [Rhizomicrobium sp.]